MNLINDFLVGAGIGREFSSPIVLENWANSLYRGILNYANIQEPLLAPKHSQATYSLTSTAAGAGAIAALAATVLGTDKKISASVAATAAVLLSITEDYDEILEPVATIGNAIVAAQTVYAIGSFLCSGAQALAGRVRHIIGR